MYDPILRTHKLKWKLDWYYSFSIDYSYRVLFKFLDRDKILFLNVWDHDIYK